MQSRGVSATQELGGFGQVFGSSYARAPAMHEARKLKLAAWVYGRLPKVGRLGCMVDSQKLEHGRGLTMLFQALSEALGLEPRHLPAFSLPLYRPSVPTGLGLRVGWLAASNFLEADIWKGLRSFRLEAVAFFFSLCRSHEDGSEADSFKDSDRK